MTGKIVEKLFYRCVNNRFALSEHYIPDRLHQVGFTQSYPSVDKERIVDDPRFFTDVFGGDEGKVIGIADNKVLKCIGRVEQ